MVGRSKVAIAAAHQRKAGLHQADGPIAQIVGFPGALGDTPGAEQNFGDHAISIAVHSRIECAKGQRQSLAPLLATRRGMVDLAAAAERAPQPTGGMRADLKIIVQRQLDGVGRGIQRRLLQPKPMLDTTQSK